jgi:acetyltransferase-like isoleucine patch superfamily enzyme
MNSKEALRRIAQDPAMAFRLALSLFWGQYYKWKFRLLGRRVIIGKFFRVTGPLDIQGPGTVIFGDHCTVSSSRLRPTTPYTHAADSVIKFGNRVMLTRTRLGCVNRIEVDDDAGLAEAWIMDSDFHSVEPTAGPRYNTKGVSKPVIIGRNAWIGAGAMVLKGVRVGANSIVGAGAVVAYNVPADAVVFGNPARVVWRLRRPAATQHS